MDNEFVVVVVDKWWLFRGYAIKLKLGLEIGGCCRPVQGWATLLASRATLQTS